MKMKKYPPAGTWCWVTNGKDAWPALHRPNAAGGWTNEDTWEDFDLEVIAWRPIKQPSVASIITTPPMRFVNWLRAHQKPKDLLKPQEI